MIDITKLLPSGFCPDADFIERFINAPDERGIIDNCAIISRAILEDRENQERRRGQNKHNG